MAPIELASGYRQRAFQTCFPQAEAICEADGNRTRPRSLAGALVFEDQEGHLAPVASGSGYSASQ